MSFQSNGEMEITLLLNGGDWMKIESHNNFYLYNKGLSTAVKVVLFQKEIYWV